MTTNTTLTSAQAAQLKRLEDSDAKVIANAKANLKSKYGLTDDECETLVREDIPGKPAKLKVTYACRTCGKPVTRYTSDLFVVGADGKAIHGKVRDCQDCLKLQGKGKSEETKNLRAILQAAKKAGVQAIVDGKINPALVSTEETA